MKVFTILTLVATTLAATVPLEKRQSSSDFTRGGCKGVVMVYARGSTELGNVGTLGPGLKSGLDRAFNRDFALEGVEYPADLLSNILPDGSNQFSINRMADLIQRVYNQCPSARIVAGGYSQGSAVAANAIEKLPSAVKDRIDAVVFFGYTKNLQNRGGIPGFPKDKLKVICNIGDLVCTGTLIITPAHLTYTLDINSAVRFIEDKVQR